MGGRRKRCVVPGCTSQMEEILFQRELSYYGHTDCKFHKTDTLFCNCTTSLKLISFPKNSDDQRAWLQLITLDPDRVPSSVECICNKHFDAHGKPTLHIGGNELDTNEILEQCAKIDHLSSKQMNGHSGLNESTASMNVHSYASNNDLAKHVGTVIGMEEVEAISVNPYWPMPAYLTPSDDDHAERHVNNAECMEDGNTISARPNWASLPHVTSSEQAKKSHPPGMKLQSTFLPRMKSGVELSFSVDKGQLALLFKKCLTCDASIDQRSLCILYWGRDKKLFVQYTCAGCSKCTWYNI